MHVGMSLQPFSPYFRPPVGINFRICKYLSPLYYYSKIRKAEAYQLFKIILVCFILARANLTHIHSDNLTHDDILNINTCYYIVGTLILALLEHKIVGFG